MTNVLISLQIDHQLDCSPTVTQVRILTLHQSQNRLKICLLRVLDSFFRVQVSLLTNTSSMTYCQHIMSLHANMQPTLGSNILLLIHPNQTSATKGTN